MGETKPEPQCECGVQGALELLVNRLDAVHANHHYQDVWQSYMIHGGDYTSGPKYEKELTAARVALSDLGSCVQLQRQNECLRMAVRNQAGDNLCWLNGDEVKIPPEGEFLESCRRYHTQLSKDGVLAGAKTIAQLEAECERLREQNEGLRAAVRNQAKTIGQLQNAAAVDDL